MIGRKWKRRVPADAEVTPVTLSFPVVAANSQTYLSTAQDDFDTVRSIPDAPVEPVLGVPRCFGRSHAGWRMDCDHLAQMTPEGALGGSV